MSLKRPAGNDRPLGKIKRGGAYGDVKRVIENGKMAKPDLGARIRIAVASAKGGAGKSTLTVNLAARLALNGRKVGIFDADVGTPSIAAMLGLMPGILIPNNGAVEPVTGPLGIKVVGADLIAGLPIPLLCQDEPSTPDAIQVVHGTSAPLGSLPAADTRLLSNGISFPNLDLLFIDLATGAACLREVADTVQLSGVLIVTQSSPSALRATRALVAAALSIPVVLLGIVENMTAFYCRQCRSVRPLLPGGGVFELCRETKLLLLARLPFDPDLAEACERGSSFVQQVPDAPLTKQFADLAQKVVAAADEASYHSSHSSPNGGFAR